jgi:hypothetical protein
MLRVHNLADLSESRRVNISMGEAGNFTTGRYLDYYNGQISSANNGYVMMRSGSIVGVSCAFQTTGTYFSNGDTTIEVRVNGSAVFSATVTTTGAGAYAWSDTQKAGIDTFAVDDVITLYCTPPGGSPVRYTVTDVCAIAELVFDS